MYPDKIDCHDLFLIFMPEVTVNETSEYYEFSSFLRINGEPIRRKCYSDDNEEVISAICALCDDIINAKLIVFGTKVSLVERATILKNICITLNDTATVTAERIMFSSEIGIGQICENDYGNLIVPFVVVCAGLMFYNKMVYTIDTPNESLIGEIILDPFIQKMTKAEIIGTALDIRVASKLKGILNVK